MSSKPVFLDVDSSIVENNLLITKNEEDEFSRLFQDPGDKYPSQMVKPSPGICIKTKELGTETKIFVNICQTDAIPPPADISEEDLIEILNSDDVEASAFRIPMSIGDIRDETDTKGERAKACDVAINPTFFKKIQTIPLFKRFVMMVIFEGLSNKHNLHATDERIVLKNRRAYGNLQMHRIQQRDVDEKMGKVWTDATSTVDELLGKTEQLKPKPKIETISSTDFSNSRIPEYRLFKRSNEPNLLLGEFKLPDVITSEELTLDVGEDRIIFESKKLNYFLDVFIPCNVNQEEVSSTFNKSSKILTVTMPILIS